MVGCRPLIRQLDLSVNQLSGSIPDSIRGLAFLAHVDLSFNEFSAVSAAVLWTLPYIDISSCALTGTMPTMIASYLTFYGSPTLNASNNYFVGPLPEESLYSVPQSRMNQATFDLSNNCMDAANASAIVNYCDAQHATCLLRELPPASCLGNGSQPVAPTSVKAVEGVLSASIAWQPSAPSVPIVLQVY